MTDTGPIVFIVDDNDDVRTSLVNLCQSVNLTAQAFSSIEAFLREARPNGPACLILDVRFPGSGSSGLEFQRRLAEGHALLPIIFISGHADVPMSVQAMKRGAVDFLIKPIREQDLLDAIHEALARDRHQRQRHAAAEVLRQRFELLSARERTIMRLVTTGLLNKQIAADLDLSEVTVKVHRGHIMEKMQATSLPDLVRMMDQLAETPADDTTDQT